MIKGTSYIHSNGIDDERIDPALVLEELSRILSSRYFQTSRRSKEFLEYVVNQTMGGNGDLLKERLIGSHIFGRKPDYATGEDPVVRVQAGEVRRRLELYYAENEGEPDVLIQIPLGSYTPVFRSRRSQRRKSSERDIAGLEQSGTQASGWTDALREPDIDVPIFAHDETEPLGTELLAKASVATFTAEPKSSETTIAPEADGNFGRLSENRHRVIGKKVLVSVFVCVVLLAFVAAVLLRRGSDSAQKNFWSPASVSSKPVLICLPQPMLYRPSEKLFDRYRALHPDALITREAREDRFLPLAPTESIQWGDMKPDYNSGPGIGGVIAAVHISKLLTEQGIPFELRFGSEASYAEMRSSPVVIIGAINTDWATQLTSGSKFVFDETPGAPGIRETGGAKRVWKMEAGNGDVVRDYGLITRELSGKTGRFFVQVAGITHFGTEAASEFLTNQQEFAAALRSESISLRKQNLQIVVSTDVTDRRAGPPRVVAIDTW